MLYTNCRNHLEVNLSIFKDIYFYNLEIKARSIE